MSELQSAIQDVPAKRSRKTPAPAPVESKSAAKRKAALNGADPVVPSVPKSEKRGRAPLKLKGGKTATEARRDAAAAVAAAKDDYRAFKKALAAAEVAASEARREARKALKAFGDQIGTPHLDAATQKQLLAEKNDAVKAANVKVKEAEKNAAAALKAADKADAAVKKAEQAKADLEQKIQAMKS